MRRFSLIVLLPILLLPTIASAACQSTPTTCAPGKALVYEPSTPSCPSGNYTCVSRSAQPKGTVAKPGTTKSTASAVLKLGSRGDQVVLMQRLLIENGYLAAGSDTGYFGLLTKAAVQKFQRERGIVSSGTESSTGYGAVGPKTRDALAMAESMTPTPADPTTTRTSASAIEILQAKVQELLARIAAIRSAQPPQQTPPAHTTTTPIVPPPTTPQSCAFNGTTIAHGQSVTAYQSASVPAGQSCVSEQRVCANGALSGSYAYESCTPPTSNCPAGYIFFGNLCHPTERVCSGTNGDGVQTFSNGSYGTCRLTSCAPNFHLNVVDNSCDRNIEEAPGVGGTNFALIHQSDYTQDPMWEKTQASNACSGSDLRSIIAVYDDPAAKKLIDSKLQRMYDAGQRKISLILWHFHNQWDGGYDKDMWCIGVNAPGKLSSRHAANLKALVKKIRSIGFNQITMRLAPSDQSDPRNLTPTAQDGTWNWRDPNDPVEDQVATNWVVLQDVRTTVLDALGATSGNVSSPRVLFDLGLELGGNWFDNQIQKAYVMRIWEAYTRTYGLADTMGFSIVPASAVYVTNTIDAYDQVAAMRGLSAGSLRPYTYGFDVYGLHPNFPIINGITDLSSIATFMKNAGQGLVERGEAGKEVFVQEALFNSPDVRRYLDEGARASGVSIRYIMQWPELPGGAGVVDFSPFNFYLPPFN